ncbi:MAG TPA: TonB family protein [bacterium]
MKPCFILFFAISIVFAQENSVNDTTSQPVDSVRLEEKLNQLEPAIRLPSDSIELKEKYNQIELPSPKPVDLDSNTPPVMSDSHPPTLLDEQGEPIKEGECFIKALIDLDGSVLDIKITKSSGYPKLDSTAIELVRQWKFYPAKQNGKPVRVWIGAPVKFKLDDSDAPKDTLHQSKVSTLSSYVLEKAIDSLKLEIEKKSNEWKLYFDLGVGYTAISNYTDALQAFNRALELKGNDNAIKYKIAFLYYCMDSFEIAKYKFEELINDCPDKIRLYEWIIDLYAILDNSEELITTYEKYCKINDIYTSTGFGMIYALAGDYKNAIKYYQKTIDVRYNSRLMIAMLYLNSGDSASADETLKQYIQAIIDYYNKHDDLALLNNKAVAYYRMSRSSSALQAADDLVAKNQTDGVNIFNCGVFKIAAGDTSGLTDIRRACSFDTTGFVKAVYKAMLAIRTDSLAIAESLLSQTGIRYLTTSGMANGLLAYCLEKRGKRLLAYKHWINCYGLTPLGTDVESIRSYIIKFIETLKYKQ